MPTIRYSVNTTRTQADGGYLNPFFAGHGLEDNSQEMAGLFGLAGGLFKKAFGLFAGKSAATLSVEAVEAAAKDVVKGETKLLSQFTESTINDAVQLVIKDKNKLAHLFPSKHKLDGLVESLGGYENTVRAVMKAANGKLPSNGLFKDIPVVVNGSTVYLRGNVINGIPRLGTMFIK